MEDRFLRRKTDDTIAGHHQFSGAHEKPLNTGLITDKKTIVVRHFFPVSYCISNLYTAPISLFFQDLEQLAAELRVDIVYSVAKTGGHLSSSLGVVELAVALHHVFNTPDDRIIWDVGHQVKLLLFLFQIGVDF